MKILIPFLTIPLVLFSCSQDNLDGKELQVNQYENISEGFVTVKSYNSIDNSIGRMSVEVHPNRFPAGIEFTEISIIDPFGDTVRTKKMDNIFVKRNPTGSSIYLLGLHNSNKPKKSSAHFAYTFTP